MGGRPEARPPGEALSDLLRLGNPAAAEQPASSGEQFPLRPGAGEGAARSLALIQDAGALPQDAVHGDPLPLGQQEQIAQHQLLRRQEDLPALPKHPYPFPIQPLQGALRPQFRQSLQERPKQRGPQGKQTPQGAEPQHSSCQKQTDSIVEGAEMSVKNAGRGPALQAGQSGASLPGGLAAGQPLIQAGGQPDCVPGGTLAHAHPFPSVDFANPRLVCQRRGQRSCSV